MNARRLSAAGTVLLGLCCAFTGLAASLDSVDVEHEEGRFHLVADTFLEASPDAIHAVLLDFDDNRYSNISEIYKESDYLEPDTDGTPVVYTRVYGCLLFFCRDMERVERLEVVSPGFIRSRVVPERSDFKYAMSEWTLEAESQGTRVTYRMSMEPDFWLPPFVGPLFLRSILLRDGVEAVEKIEELALARDALDEATAQAR